MDDAAGNGHLDILEWLHKNRTEGYTADAMKQAIRNGHLDVVRWLYENHIVYNIESYATAIGYAAKRGHRHVVEWLRDK